MPNDKKTPNKAKRFSRFFALSTYASEKQLVDVITRHHTSVRAYAYIYHDKDENEPHYHIVIRTYSSWSVSQIQKWFSGLTDSKKEPINTFVEVANDTQALETYFTHSDEKSREEGKYEYPKEAIKDKGLWDIVSPKDSYDDSYDVICSIHLGMSVRELVRRYGRDYIYHRGAYHDCATAITVEEYRDFQNDATQRARQRIIRPTTVDINTFDLEKEFKK